MKHPHIIGLTGQAGAGKDTVRAILQEHGYHGLAFADPIREMLGALLDCTGQGRQWMHLRDLKECAIPGLDASYRQLAQTLGTEWGRTVSPDFWLRIAAAHMQSITRDGFAPISFVFSDVRFPNEADFIRQRGGVVWAVYRPGIEPVRAHASEAWFKSIEPDFTIMNTGTIEDLRATVEQALTITQDADAGMCACAHELKPSELETLRCDECGKAVVA